jgi:hypothetical protein
MRRGKGTEPPPIIDVVALLDRIRDASEEQPSIVDVNGHVTRDT